MRILDLNRRLKLGAVRLSATAETEQGRTPFELYFDFETHDLQSVDESADPVAAALLLAAMRVGEDLEISQPISPRLHFALPRIRDVFHTWWPTLYSRIKIRTVARQALSASPQQRAATFFSGGVDSFYNLAKLHSEPRAAPLTHLIFMRGVETPLERSSGVDASEAWIKDVATLAGVEALFGKTNVRSCIPLAWESFYHGSALAAIALCLGPRFGYVSIASTYTYKHLFPYGSSPLVDEMYSTENTQIIHEGSEATRPKKLEIIMEWNRDIGLNYLRTCLQNAGGAFNCGRCRKCVRTAIPLYTMGLWDQANTFLDKSKDHWEDVAKKDKQEFNEENLEFVRERGGEQWLVNMLERVIQRREMFFAKRALRAASAVLNEGHDHQRRAKSPRPKLKTKKLRGTKQPARRWKRLLRALGLRQGSDQKRRRKRSSTALVKTDEPAAEWLTLDELAEITAGTWVNMPSRGWHPKGISFSTRLKPASLMIPKNNSFLHGLDLAELDDLQLKSCGLLLEQRAEGLSLPQLLVPSLPDALARLAGRIRENYTGKICAVTGGVGKSSTCRVLHHAISQQALCASYQECNTLDGIHAQIANLASEAFCIVEVASSALPQANAILRPHVAVATDFAATPLLHPASALAETAKRTAALFASIEPGGIAIINRSSPHFDCESEVAPDQTRSIISYGDHPDADGRLLDYQFEKQLVRASIFGEEIAYRLGMPGRHNAMNSLAALIALHALGLDWRKAASQFCALQALPGRGRHIQRRIDGKSILLIDDAHEAKPMSMMAAFDVLAHMTPGPGGRRIAVLADMSELDSESPRCHAELAYPIIQAGIDRIYAAGELIKHLWCELPESIRGSIVGSAEELLPILRAEIVDGDVILFKGSKTTNLSEVIKGFHDLSPIVTRFQWQLDGSRSLAP